MTQAAHVSPDPLDVFQLRCESQAFLVEIGDVAFLNAVDALQADAEFDGLVEQFGQQIIQQIMALAFGGTR